MVFNKKIVLDGNSFHQIGSKDIKINKKIFCIKYRRL